MNKKTNKSVEERLSSIEDDSPDKMKDKSGELGDHGNSLEDDGSSDQEKEKAEDKILNTNGNQNINMDKDTDADIHEQNNNITFENDGKREKTSCRKKMINNYKFAKKKFSQQTLTVQVGICLTFFLTIPWF